MPSPKFFSIIPFPALAGALFAIGIGVSFAANLDPARPNIGERTNIQAANPDKVNELLRQLDTFRSANANTPGDLPKN